MAVRAERPSKRTRSDFAVALARVPAVAAPLPFLMVLDGDRLRRAVEDDRIAPVPKRAPEGDAAPAFANGRGSEGTDPPSVASEAVGDPSAAVGDPPEAVGDPPGGWLTLAYGRLDSLDGANTIGFWSDDPHIGAPPPLDRAGGAGDPSPAWPVLLVFDPQVFTEGAHFYPFPRAAWSSGRLDRVMLGTESIAPFDLIGQPAAPARLVRAFYRTNLNFVNAHPVPERRYVRKRRFALDGYAAWLQETEAATAPELATPELWLDKPLPLAAYLQAVMLPTMLLSDRIIADYLIDTGAELRTYPHLGGVGPATRQPLRGLYMDFLQGRGLLGHGR